MGKRKMISLPVGIGIGVICSLIISAVSAAIIAYMIGAEILSQDTMGYGAMVILGLSCIAGPTVAAALTKEKRLLVCVASVCGYLLILLGCTAIFFGGEYEGFLIGMLIAFLCCGGSVFLCSRGKNKGIPTRKNGRYR